MNIFPPITSDICYSEINSVLTNLFVLHYNPVYEQTVKRISTDLQAFQRENPAFGRCGDRRTGWG